MENPQWSITAIGLVSETKNRRNEMKKKRKGEREKKQRDTFYTLLVRSFGHPCQTVSKKHIMVFLLCYLFNVNK